MLLGSASVSQVPIRKTWSEKVVSSHSALPGDTRVLCACFWTNLSMHVRPGRAADRYGNRRCEEGLWSPPPNKGKKIVEVFVCKEQGICL